MEIDALEQLISEDVKVQGQIVCDGFKTCLMVFRIITGVVVEVVVGVVAVVVTGGDEVYHHSSSWVIAGGVRGHLNARGPLLLLHPASSWWASLESANLALACMYGFLPWANEEPASSMERRERHTGAARWDGSSSSLRNLTLMAGVVDNIEEYERGCVRGASSLQNLPPRVAGHPYDGDEEGGNPRRG
jgi:hypothetical protein